MHVRCPKGLRVYCSFCTFLSSLSGCRGVCGVRTGVECWLHPCSCFYLLVWRMPSLAISRATGVSGPCHTSTAMHKPHRLQCCEIHNASSKVRPGGTWRAHVSLLEAPCLQAVHLLHICIQLKIEQLFICIDEQPDSYVTDTNFLALTTCLFDHDRCRGRLLQFCLHKLHSLWPKLVTRCPKSLRQLLESCASAPFSDVLVDAFNLAADPEFGGCCNARCFSAVSCLSEHICHMGVSHPARPSISSDAWSLLTSSDLACRLNAWLY